MNLRAKFVFSISLLGVLGLTMPGALRADDFSFSFTMTSGGTVDGTVTGDIYGLTNNGVAGPASTVSITGYPAAYGDLGPLPLIPTGTELDNSFTEAGGTITAEDFLAIGTSPAINLDIQFGEGYFSNNTDGNTYGEVTFAPLVIATPEPGTKTLTLTGLGLLGLVVVMRKRYARSFPQAT